MKKHLFVASLFGLVLWGTASLANLIQYKLAGGGSFSAWSVSDLQNISISTTTSTNDTATVTSTSNSFVRGSATCATSQFYFELIVGDSHGSGFYGPGIANASYTVSQNIPGYDSGSNSIAFDSSGNSHIAGGSVGSGTTYANGNILGIAVDTATSKIWLWESSSGKWNGSVSNNPAVGTETGGISISSVNAGPYLPVFGSTSDATTGNTSIINTGATTFTGTVPSGYSACH